MGKLQYLKYECLRNFMNLVAYKLYSSSFVFSEVVII